MYEVVVWNRQGAVSSHVTKTLHEAKIYKVFEDKEPELRAVKEFDRKGFKKDETL